MRTETAEWLHPMIHAAASGAVDPHPLLWQASMPAAEAADPFLDQLARNAPPGATAHAMDWVRFGQLLRVALGWQHYPDVPDFPEMRHLL